MALQAGNITASVLTGKFLEFSLEMRKQRLLPHIVDSKRTKAFKQRATIFTQTGSCSCGFLNTTAAATALL